MAARLMCSVCVELPSSKVASYRLLESSAQSLPANPSSCTDTVSAAVSVPGRVSV